MAAGKVALFVLPGGGSPAPGGAVLSDRTDDDLMLLVAGGLRTAFDELVVRHRGRLLRVAVRYVRSPGLAHDVTQSTFLDVYRAAGHYQPRGSFTSFLFRALLNHCRMVQRAAASQDRLLASAAVALADPAGPETAEDRILARERERRVQRALDQLSEKLRAAVVLRYSGDLSYKEIADVLDVPVGTAKRRLFDALEKLRELLLEEP
ncbi:MAG TPA: RNA polymerase sigma factor [Kofleriaceae bacterium]|jgi:RNA polymerase sigma-70 factor (ECF subfamily)|nr:RNA polymerase sigma factor [Kofleriaceae bacterium]